MAKFSPPEKFDFTKPQNWPDWRKRWVRFHAATKLGKEDGAVQVSSLIYAMGQDAETIYESFTFDETAHKNDHKRVLAKFDAHFIPTVNYIYERAQFHRRMQQQNETVETYLRALYDLAATCDFEGPAKNVAIRDQLVIGISCSQTSERLQLKENLTLSEAIEICRSCELVKQQMANQTAATSLDAITKHPRPSRGRGYAQRPQRPPTYQPRPQSNQSEQSKCVNCGLIHRNPPYCPAEGKKCIYCQKIGHFQAVCRQRKADEANEVVERYDEMPFYNAQADDDEPAFFLGAIDRDDADAWHVNLKLNSQTHKFKIDTGADATCITESVYRRMHHKPLLAQNHEKITTVAGQVRCLGKFDTVTTHNRRRYNLTIRVIRSETPACILSRSAAVAMGLVSLNSTVNDTRTLIDHEPIPRITSRYRKQPRRKPTLPNRLATLRGGPFAKANKLYRRD